MNKSNVLGSTTAGRGESLPHPFHPLEVEIVGYLANQWDVPTLLTIFLGGWVGILGFTLVITSYLSPGLRRADKAILLWFVLSMSFFPRFESE